VTKSTAIVAGRPLPVIGHSGSMHCMARQKATITVDRAKVATARTLIRAKSISDTIDAALDRLIRTEQLRRDVAAYTGKPLTEHELVVADLPVELDLGDDDIDYDAIYGKRR
jgi:hypothetical protein